MLDKLGAFLLLVIMYLCTGLVHVINKCAFKLLSVAVIPLPCGCDDEYDDETGDEYDDATAIICNGAAMVSPRVCN
jgi:hypothetical protein